MMGGWTQYVKLIQQAGADALELNIYYIPTNLTLPAVRSNTPMRTFSRR